MFLMFWFNVFNVLMCWFNVFNVLGSNPARTKALILVRLLGKASCTARNHGLGLVDILARSSNDRSVVLVLLLEFTMVSKRLHPELNLGLWLNPAL